ncbi:GTA-gp10 family protein [Falsigemmobacter faecalis]|uniref:Gene transfer agent family protein n=1 Tax=Falsigemmobacter faecalis TaxID=2488730 RepID=A0A3P3DDS9_9RHOB|nr:GTA-gp10 family protein [Falsigemmobacter faecalis]RRH71994.1 hypothetical protein EG244_15890 [Falsigemmobacter faecalis]
MANPFKGEIALTHAGRNWTLRLDFNALCDFEGETGKNALQALEGLERGDVTASDLRALMWAGLRQEAPEIDLQTAGRILGENQDALIRAATAASPEDEPGNAPRPRGKARAK